MTTQCAATETGHSKLSLVRDEGSGGKGIVSGNGSKTSIGRPRKKGRAIIEGKDLLDGKVHIMYEEKVEKRRGERKQKLDRRRQAEINYRMNER